MTVRALSYLSVCSGIEAATVAWHPLGWRPFGFSEIEAFPSAVLAHHYRTVPNFGDMTRFKDWPDADVDVLVGGTPCQSFSVAGLRKGMADPRGNLALIYLAIADRYRPEWILWENVPGVLSSDGGRDFGAIVGGMVELGYSPSWRVLDAQYVRVDGYDRAVPQRRRRVFVVGHLGDWRRAAAVLFERESLSGNSPPRRQARQDVAGTLSARTQGGGGLGTDFELGGGVTPVSLCLTRGTQQRSDAETETLIPIQRGGFFDDEVSHPLRARHNAAHDDSKDSYVVHALRADGFDASEDGAGRGTPLIAQPYTLAIRGRGDTHQLEYREDGTANAVLTPNGGRGGIGVGAIAFDTTQITSKTNRCQPQPDGPCHPLAAGAHPPAIAFDCKAGGETSFAIGDVPGALRGDGHGGGHAAVCYDDYNQSLSDVAHTVVKGCDNRQPHAFDGWAVRRLIPLECERLQGFPDGYTAVAFRGKPAADGPRYKALGNSMAVNCMRWIGRRIAMVDALAANCADLAVMPEAATA